MMTESGKLLREIQRLEQENKTLALRVQGVEVLGKKYTYIYIEL